MHPHSGLPAPHTKRQNSRQPQRAAGPRAAKRRRVGEQSIEQRRLGAAAAAAAAAAAETTGTVWFMSWPPSCSPARRPNCGPRALWPQPPPPPPWNPPPFHRVAPGMSCTCNVPQPDAIRAYNAYDSLYLLHGPHVHIVAGRGRLVQGSVRAPRPVDVAHVHQRARGRRRGLISKNPR